MEISMSLLCLWTDSGGAVVSGWLVIEELFESGDFDEIGGRDN